MKKLIAATIATIAFFIGGCSTGDTIGATNPFSMNGNPGGGTAPTQKAASTALYQVKVGLLPYPFDVYFANSTDGTLNIQPANALIPNQAAVNSLDGFSTNAAIRERFNGPIDVASLATPGAVVMIHISTNNAGPQAKAPVEPAIVGGTGAFAPLLGCVVGGSCAGADYSVGVAADDATILEITPLHPLAASTCLPTPPATTSPCAAANGGNGEAYLVLLSNLITVGGAAAVPDTDYASFLTALATSPICASITDPQLNPVCQLTGAHLGLAQLYAHLAPGYNPANIVASFSFSTQSTVDSLEILSATTPPQALKLNATGLPTSAANPKLAGHADFFVGVLTVPYYLSATAPLTASWQAAPFALDPTSTNVTRFNPVPVATQTLMIPVLATVPNANSAFVKACIATPPCPTTWPVLIFQHGITRNREDMFGVADSFADAGFAVVAIDLPLHGVTSTADPLYASAANPLYAGLGLPMTQQSIERTFDLDTSGMAGQIDPSGSHFINLASLLTSRDNLRQGAADLITLERSVAGATLNNVPGAPPIFAAGKTHYLGHSLGAIVGTVFLGVVPASDVSTGTLASPGGNVTQLLLNSPTFAPVINAGLEAQGLIPGTTLYAQFFRDAQNAVDSGDPISYVAQAAALHPIHLLQVVGGGGSLPDQVVPNSATAALIKASAYGPVPLSQIKASQAPIVNVAAGIRGYVNFTQGDHGSIIDDVVPAVTAEMQTEAISFTGAPIPPAGIPANTPGSTLLIANPTVIQ